MTASDVSGRGGDGEQDEDGVLAAEDIAALNGQAVARAAAFARLAGTGLVVAGAIAGVAWLWTAYRVQMRADDFADVEPITFGDGASEEESAVSGQMFDAFGAAFDVTFADRVDLLARDVELALVGALAVGVGLTARLAADYTVARTGGSLTGFEVGDRV